jgi:16S rRNA (guanine527-N7)-methyltransferase
MMHDAEVETRLQAGFLALGIDAETAPFMAYLNLLLKWNKAYNLTAVRDVREMATRHVLDSLAIAPWLRGRRWLDVGTGPGLPGIPLALLHRDAALVLLDSNGKKTRFLREVVRVLSLKHVDVVESRVEAYHSADGFDTVVSRAFSAMKPMIENTRHLIAKDGLWLAMKGHIPEDELKTLGMPWHAEAYTVPGVSGARCCILVEDHHDD